MQGSSSSYTAFKYAAGSYVELFFKWAMFLFVFQPFFFQDNKVNARFLFVCLLIQRVRGQVLT